MIGEPDNGLRTWKTGFYSCQISSYFTASSLGFLNAPFGGTNITGRFSGYMSTFFDIITWYEIGTAYNPFEMKRFGGAGASVYGLEKKENPAKDDYGKVVGGSAVASASLGIIAGKGIGAGCGGGAAFYSGTIPRESGPTGGDGADGGCYIYIH